MLIKRIFLITLAILNMASAIAEYRRSSGAAGIAVLVVRGFMSALFVAWASPPPKPGDVRGVADLSEEAILQRFAQEGYRLSRMSALEIRIPSPVKHQMAGALCLALLALLAGYLGYGMWTVFQREGSFSAQNVASAAIVVMLFFAGAGLYPWWWFMGGERIVLSDQELAYWRPLRGTQTYPLRAIHNVRQNQNEVDRRLRFYYRIHFNVPPTDIPVGIGKHLREDMAALMVRLIQLRIAAASGSGG